MEKTQDNNQNKRFYPFYDESIWLRSCEKEISEPLPGEINGLIPTWLNGSLLRNGPGTLKFGKDEFSHIFDASALLHKFDIQNGKITYQCKFLQSEAYKSNSKCNRIIVNEFGTIARAPDPCHSIFKRFAGIFLPRQASDNANISLYPFGDEIYAFSESRVLYKVKVDDLSTGEVVRLTDYMAILHNTSHPHVEKNGTVYNLGLSLNSRKPHHIVMCHPKAESGREMFEKSRIVASIPAQWRFHPSYMHSFGLTENYFIIVEQPLTLCVPKIVLAKIKGDTLASSLKWFPGEYAKFNVISRKTGKLYRTFLAETFFYFHIIQQYEEDNHIVIDICTYDDGSVLDSFYIKTIRTIQSNPNESESIRSRPKRFVLPLNPEPTNNKIENLVTLKRTKAEAHFILNEQILVKPEIICDSGCELPRINYNLLGKPYRYFYAINSDIDVESTGGIIKVDTFKKEYMVWWEKDGTLGEPIFIPNPDAKTEDDGVVLSAMLWSNKPQLVGLLILDGQTFKEIGRATFHTSTTIPKSFHGWFVPY